MYVSTFNGRIVRSNIFLTVWH